jgi:hypothetical protein
MTRLEEIAARYELYRDPDTYTALGVSASTYLADVGDLLAEIATLEEELCQPVRSFDP